MPHLQRPAPLENVTLTGGEPTLHPDLPAFCSALRPKVKSLTLATSASCLSRVFPEVRDLLTSYLISVDGVDPDTYSASRGVELHDYALSWIRTLRRASDAHIAANCVVQKVNFDKIYDIVVRCLHAGAHFMFLTAVSYAEEAYGRENGAGAAALKAIDLSEDELAEADRQLRALARDFPDRLPTREHFPAIIELLRGRPAWQDQTCDVPWTSFVVDVDGQVLPCFYMPFRSAQDGAAERRLVADVQNSMLGDAEFRAKHCDRCPCFMGRRRPLDLMRAAHDALLKHTLADPEATIWGAGRQAEEARPAP